LRDVPDFAPTWAAWQPSIRDIAQQTAARLMNPEARDLHAQAWRGLYTLCAGVVLEDRELIEHAAAHFRHIINHEIHPQGYAAKLTDPRDEGSLARQLLCTQALVLTAEAGAHVGLDLWQHQARGVSVMTAAYYPIYYFYHPHKWKWNANLTTDIVQPLYRRHAGLWEMVYARAQNRDVKVLLDDLRPIYDWDGGGPTTLTHGVAKKRGWFG
jgi:hypothetical protein